MKKIYERAKRMVVRKIRMSEQWEDLPRGWTKESLRQYWGTLTGGTPAGEGGVRKCIKKIKDVYPDIDDAGAFCGSLADELFPGWRKKAAEERRKKKKKKG